MQNRKFQIMTDSGCDLPDEYFTEKNVECMRLGFILDNVEYYGENGGDISLKEFYNRLRDGALPTTYQITPEIAKEHIERYLEKGMDVFVLVFSSKSTQSTPPFRFVFLCHTRS